MPTTTDKRDGFTKVPNAILYDSRIKPTDKLVLVYLKSFAFDGKPYAYPSQVRIADELSLDREAVRKSLRNLSDLRVIERVKRRGHGEWEYRVCLDRYLAEIPPPPGGNPAMLAGGNPATNKSKQEDPLKTDSRNVDGIDPLAEVTVERLPAMPTQGPGGNPATFTKAEINRHYLKPNGLQGSGDFDDLSVDVNMALAEVKGGIIYPKELRRLADIRGIEFAQMWAAWLPRKVAAEYEAGRPVENVTGLYVRAIEQGWEVNPKWPEYVNPDALDPDELIPF